MGELWEHASSIAVELASLKTEFLRRTIRKANVSFQRMEN